MKKYALKLAVASALALPMAFANAAIGTINFTGEVTNETCSLGADSSQISVPLGSYAVHHINATDRTELKDFVINLTGCDSSMSQNATFTFRGTPLGSTTEQLKLTSAAGAEAQGIAIGITTTPGDPTAAATRVQFDGTSPLNMALQDGTNTLQLYAFYEKIAGGTVTAGPANAKATFEVTYP